MIQASRFATLGVLIAISTIAATAIAASETTGSSAWDGDRHAPARLVAGGAEGDSYLAGIEIGLEPGWVTYWRYPGDSGIPLRVDFSASANLKQATLLWPAPQRIDKGGVISIGYTSSTIFPVRLVPLDPAKPVTLHARLQYGACEKICIPATADASLTVTRAPGPQSALVSAALHRVPRPAAVGEGRGSGLSIRAVRREGRQVLVDIAAAPGVSVDLFAEGPTDDWALPLPQPVEPAANGLHRFKFTLDGAPAGSEGGPVRLRLTATAGTDSIDVSARLD